MILEIFFLIVTAAMMKSKALLYYNILTRELYGLVNKHKVK